MLDRIAICLRCGRAFEPENRPGHAACPECGSYLRWGDVLAARASVSRVRCLIPAPATTPLATDPALLEQLRTLYRKQPRHRRKDKDNADTETDGPSRVRHVPVVAP